MKFVHLALAVTLCGSLYAQTPFTDPANLRGERVKPRDGRELPIDGGQGNAALGLEQLLRKLNTRASILNIVAHPDDEDGGMLTYYSRGLGARVADLSLTRGEGGQNAMTGDFEDALGLLRTQELLANDRYVGVDQMFGTEVDFGFSKTKSEAFAKWTHERVLFDAVRAVRLYRPLVITSTWIGSVTDGHGQHQVSGEITQEAFLKAGDPTVFPEMIAEGILPWQPLRVYARVPTQSISEKGLFDYATGQYVTPSFTNYVTGEVSKTPPTADVIVHEGLTDPLLTAAAASPVDLRATHFDAPANAPLTYVQFARIGLGLQRSQIPAGFRMPPAGNYDVPYHLYGACPTTDFKACHPSHRKGPASLPELEQASFFAGIDTSLVGIAALAPEERGLRERLVAIAAHIQQANASYDARRLEKLAPILSAAIKQTDELIGVIEASTQLAPIESANVLHELRIKRVQLNDALVLSLGVTLQTELASRIQPGTHLGLASDLKFGVSEFAPIPLAPNSVVYVISRLSGGALSSPLNREIISGPAFKTHVQSIQLNGVPAPPNAVMMFQDEIKVRDDAPPTRPYFTRPTIEQPFYDLIDPSLRNAPTSPAPLVLEDRIVYEKSALELASTVTAGTSHSSGEFSQPLIILSPGATAASFRTIGYGDLPRTAYYPPAPKRVSMVGLNLPSKRRIGYIPGTGDAVPEALASIGLPVTTLTVADLTPATLAKFDTVVLGVRTYAAHADLHGAPTQALLEYARGGGNVLVQYQTAEFTAADAPYPLTLGRDAEKVVDETAPVKLLLPAQPGTAPGGIAKETPSTTPTMEYALLNTPNTITSADFNGWVEERGHGFLRTWDAHYAALTETHDPGSAAEGVQPQEPQRGGLITTPLGKGRWTYCAFAIYRQLPEAVPGAFRLFVNLLNP